MTDWSTVASFATAGGTLVLAVATFGATRSANRSARITERAFEAQLRPMLVPSRLEDPPEKIMWGDQHWTRVPGGRAVVEIGDDAVYLSMSLRNVGSGMAVIHAWRAVLDEGPVLQRRLQLLAGRLPPPGRARRAGAGGDGGRHPPAPVITVWLLDGDHEGGQRTVSRFGLLPPAEQADDQTVWIMGVNRHWNLDRGDPR